MNFAINEYWMFVARKYIRWTNGDGDGDGDGNEEWFKREKKMEIRLKSKYAKGKKFIYK